jgi:calcineurin-like phosphoesterase family protein
MNLSSVFREMNYEKGHLCGVKKWAKGKDEEESLFVSFNEGHEHACRLQQPRDQMDVSVSSFNTRLQFSSKAKEIVSYSNKL